MRIKGIKIRMISVMIALLAVMGAIWGYIKKEKTILTSAEQRRIPIYSVETEQREVALTFDAAWGNSDTDELITLLERYAVTATFFVTGDWCDRCGEDVKKLSAAGHRIENHSDTHPHPNQLTAEELMADTAACSRKIEALTGNAPKLYRAPYGEYCTAVVKIIEDRMGLRMIQWDADSLDWKRCGATAAVENVMRNLQNGSILLFHNDVEDTVDAVEKTIVRLKARGYRFVTVEELIDPENYALDRSGRQRIVE